jgi:hypothetical protein
VLIFVGAPEIGISVGDIVGLAVGVRVGLGPQRVASYVAVGIEAQSALVALKNPISFHVGRIEMSEASQTYDRIKLVISPCPGKLDPKEEVKWYGFVPK